MKKDKKNLIGMSVIILLIIMILSLLFLKNIGYYSFFITYSKIKKLKKGNSIYLKGAEIGLVRDIIFKENKIFVKVSIKTKYKNKLPVDSQFFIITDTFITGKKCLEVKLGRNRENIKNNQIIKGSEGIRGFFNKLEKKFK